MLARTPLTWPGITSGLGLLPSLALPKDQHFDCHLSEKVDTRGKFSFRFYLSAETFVSFTKIACNLVGKVTATNSRLLFLPPSHTSELFNFIHNMLVIFE